MHLLELTNTESLAGHEIGGKAGNLVRLATAGIPVPDGWVVPAEAFDLHLRSHGLTDRAVAVARSGEQAACRSLRETIIAAELGRALVSALSALATPPMAVRSSASVEDQAAASYSGLFGTVLGVKGTDALVRAVKCVWASVFTAQVLAYHRKMKPEMPYPGMAVLIMPMVAADAAGVAFSANPADGNPFEIVVSVCHGLGATVVDGSEPCDQYRLDLDTLNVTHSIPGAQTSGLFLQADGTVEKRSVPCQLMGLPVCREAQLTRLGEAVRRIDEILDSRIDVEFAFADGGLWVLQARPLVGLPPCFPDDPRETDSTWASVQQEVLEPMSPFLRQAVSDCFQRRTSLKPPPWPPEVYDVCFVHGRMFSRTPGSTGQAREWWDHSWIAPMLALDDPEEEFRPWYEWTGCLYNEVIPQIRQDAEQILRLTPEELASRTDDELVELLQQTYELAKQGSDVYCASSSATADSLLRVDNLLKEWVVNGDWKQSTVLAVTMVQGAPKLTLERDAELESVARGDDTLADFICRWGYSYLRRDEQTDIALWRSWKEDPTPLLRAIKLMNKAPERRALTERTAEAKREFQRKYEELRAAVLASHPVEGKRRERVFETCVRAARAFFRMKDDRDIVECHASAAMRWILMEAARRIIRDEIIACERDLFLFRPAEIVGYFQGGRTNGAALASLAAPRAQEMKREARYRLPPRQLLGDTEDDGGTIVAAPASPGVAEGPARVIQTHRQEELDALQPREILVLCGDAKVAWTMYFSIIAGLVYECGNWLCHETNLCRELGIPAVVCVPNIGQIRTGDLLRVDGTGGTVTRLQKGAEGGTRP